MPKNLDMKLFSLLSRSFHCCPRDSQTVLPTGCYGKGAAGGESGDGEGRGPEPGTPNTTCVGRKEDSAVNQVSNLIM